MRTSIRVSEETKSMLAGIKEDSESWDEFLNRLARSQRDVEERGEFAYDGLVEDMEETEKELNRSFRNTVEDVDNLP